MPTTYLIYRDDRMLGLCAGEEPADAVDAYYAGLDDYQEPLGELTETFSVAKRKVPAPSVATIEALRNEGEAGDTLPEIEEVVMAAYALRWQVIDVVANGRRSTSRRG